MILQLIVGERRRPIVGATVQSTPHLERKGDGWAGSGAALWQRRGSAVWFSGSAHCEVGGSRAAERAIQQLAMLNALDGMWCGDCRVMARRDPDNTLRCSLHRRLGVMFADKSSWGSAGAAGASIVVGRADGVIANPRYRRNATPPATGGGDSDAPPVKRCYERGMVEASGVRRERFASASLARMVIGA